MNKYHQEILKEIKKYSHPEPFPDFNLRYLGTHSPCFGIRTPDHQSIIKNFIKSHSNFSLEEYMELLNSLSDGKYHEEKNTVGGLLVVNPKLASQIDPKILDQWLSNREGWLEVDSLCQSSFSAKILLDNWPTWQKLLKNFNQDKHISKRRASLVLLNKSVGQSDDQKLAGLALENINNLKHEKDILITKAISWLLRSLIKNHRQRVEEYLKENANSLPKIAIRETKKKLETGKK